MAINVLPNNKGWTWFLFLDCRILKLVVTYWAVELGMLMGQIGPGLAETFPDQAHL